MGMTIAAILAGGLGSRMGCGDMPKQYLQVGARPVIVHTAEKFLTHPQVDHVLVLAPRPWIAFTQNSLAEHLPAASTLTVTEGGETRNDTISNALTWIAEQFGIKEDHIILTHDAVRPFVTHRIISDNIAAAREHGACDTAIPATDTIVRSEDGLFISEIPPRSALFQGQTPQSFRCNKLRALIDSLTPEEETRLTDACCVFALRREPVFLVPGEVHNIKITYPFDLKIAQAMLEIKEEEHFDT